MRWHEITVQTTEEAVEPIAHFFHEHGAGGVSIEESGTLNKKRDTSLGQWYEHPLNDIPEGQAVVKGYFAEVEDPEAKLRALQAAVGELPQYGIDIGDIRWEMAEVDEEDWAHAWKQYYKPVHISPRLTVKPTWEPYEPRHDGEIVIDMDPGMAFGTGTHATTALCLRALEKVIRPGDRVIDIGTGSGILAVAAAKLGAGHVLALDLDPVAVSSAGENVRLNGLEDKVEVMQSDLLGAVKHEGETARSADVAVANILAEIIVTFVDDVYDLLSEGGRYVVSGVISQKEQMVKDALAGAGFGIESALEEEGWVVIVARKQ